MHPVKLGSVCLVVEGNFTNNPNGFNGSHSLFTSLFSPTVVDPKLPVILGSGVTGSLPPTLTNTSGHGRSSDFDLWADVNRLVDLSDDVVTLVSVVTPIDRQPEDLITKLDSSLDTDEDDDELVFPSSFCNEKKRKQIKSTNCSTIKTHKVNMGFKFERFTQFPLFILMF